DDELLAQDRRHRAGNALDLGVDEVERHRLAAEACPARRLGGRPAHPPLVQPGGGGGAGLVHSHHIKMIDWAPSRRPMMLRRFDSAASSAEAARASPRNLTPPGPQVPFPLSCSGPSRVVTESSV